MIYKWASKIKDAVGGLPEAFVYLKRDETGTSALLAQRLYEMMGRI